jgi:hypothetical protein
MNNYPNQAHFHASGMSGKNCNLKIKVVSAILLKIKKNSSEQSLPLWVRKLSHPRGEIAQRQLLRISQFSQKLPLKQN